MNFSHKKEQFLGQFFPHESVDKTEELIVSQPVMEAFMAKTMALFFVLGLMVSCASYHTERGISSVEDPEQEPQHHYGYERASSFR